MADQSGDAPAQAKYDLLSPSFYADPHATFRRMRVEDPIYWHPGLNLWVLTRYGDIQTISSDPRFSVERQPPLDAGVSEAMKPKLQECVRFVSHWMVLRDPPRHTLLRALLVKAFTPQVIGGLRPAVQGLVGEMLDAAERRGTMDIVRDLAFPLPALVIARMLGVPRDHMDAFRTWTSEVFALLGAEAATDDLVEAAYRAVGSLRQLFERLVAERREVPERDLLSQLMMVEEDGKSLDEEELVSICAFLLVAGHETTTHLIGNAMLALLKNPEQMEKLRSEPALMESAVDELLRYEGAPFLLTRRATQDLELGGAKIRANDVLLGFIQAGNRDPAVFEEPDRLDITRKGARHLGLGHGIHQCVGAALARMEVQIALGALLGRLRDLRLLFGVEEWIPSLAIHGLAALPVVFERRDTESVDDAEKPGWEGPMSVRVPLTARIPVAVPAPPLSQRRPQG